MLKRPSSRRKSHGKQIELNLVPILDTMVTLIGFLLFTTSFLSIVSIESPAPVTNSAMVEEKLKEKPLQLTVNLRDNEIEIWSPFERIPSKAIPHKEAGKPDVKGLHEALLGLKREFPEETKAVFVPAPGVNYDVLISVMDAIRSLDATDPPIFHKNPATGTDEALKTLFPEIVFGNLLGDG